jgi:hypothetical protein
MTIKIFHSTYKRQRWKLIDKRSQIQEGEGICCRLSLPKCWNIGLQESIGVKELVAEEKTVRLDLWTKIDC